MKRVKRKDSSVLCSFRATQQIENIQLFEASFNAKRTLTFESTDFKTKTSSSLHKENIRPLACHSSITCHPDFALLLQVNFSFIRKVVKGNKDGINEEK